MDYSRLTDTELIRLHRQRGLKDDRPFAEIFKRHQAQIWRVCFGIMQNEQDAEDMVQETFIKTHRGLNAYEGRSALSTWMVRIAINTCRNEYRRRRSRLQTTARGLHELDEMLSSDTAQFDRRLEVASLFRQLSERDREAIVLREIEGYAYAEIAELLDISLSAAKMRVQRARLSLQSKYRQS